ncbi:replication/maintenance protein RepL [Bacillus mycoides]|uniref:replication/maintenance protein RepL n=1 Tax=Bacillus mycoides TaxID=1405 RepID=UPI003D655B45
MSEDVEVTYGAVARIMKKLQENNFIKKKQNGVYFVNPNIMMKGNDTKRQILLIY